MTEAKHILVVDDDPKVRLLLRRCFEPEGYRVSEAGSGAEVKKLDLDKFDLVTLDLGLGDENGLEIAASIRARSDTPIIMITGKGETIDRVVGLELGADDYIAKPFHVREVLARVRSVMRRSGAQQGTGSGRQGNSGNRYRFSGWDADFAKMELKSPGGERCDLTTGEMQLLEVFVKNSGRVLSRDQLMTLLKGHEWSPYDRSVDNQVARLRKKIQPETGAPELIRTVRGAGYMFVADVQEA